MLFTSRFQIIFRTDYSTSGAHIQVNGKDCINFVTFDFLGLLGTPSVKACKT